MSNTRVMGSVRRTALVSRQGRTTAGVCIAEPSLGLFGRRWGALVELSRISPYKSV